MKPGYKQTDVGVIPEEWEAPPAREIGVFRGGNGFPLEAQGAKSGDYPFFKVSDMNNEGNETFMATANHWISEHTRKRLGATAFPANAIVFAKVGAAIFLERKKILGQPSCIDNNMAALVLDKSRADVGFVHSLLLSKKLGSLVATTALPALNGKQLGEMALTLPPLPEQRAIATALSDVDGLLGGLDRLIAKKRDLKQAAMQQLLTGQTRLPGFHGEWEETTFGSVVRHHAGNSTLIKGKLPASEAAGRFPAYSASGQDVWCDHFEYEGDAIVVSAVGSRCGKAFKASGKWCAIANTHVVWPNSAKIDTGFLAYFINDENFWQKSGTGQPFVLFAKTFARPLRLPGLPEQTAIASVLTEMDAELAALEQRREKTRALKQAMMQELLTGRTRLV